MRRLLDVLLLFGLIGAGAYVWHTRPEVVQGVLRTVESTVRPCERALTYSLSSIDPRFGLSVSSIITDLKEAEALWESDSGRDLFSYQDTGGDVTVSLVYDERQAATDRLKTAGIRIEKNKDSYEALQEKYDALLALVGSARTIYEARAESFEHVQDSYNTEVEQWNERGGAPPNVFRELEEKKSKLEAEFAELKALEETLNENIETLNAFATTINQLIVQLNLNVDQYNREGAAQGEYEAGLYKLVGGVRTIDIFEYSDRTQFVRILAHEMGHALGLEHVSDKEAIMHQVNLGERIELVSDDTAELERVCSAGFL